MTDLPRGPLDNEPNEPGWWIASDGKWYPPESAAPTQPVPISPWDETAMMPAVGVGVPAKKSPLTRVRGWPLWAKIAVPIVLVLLIAAVAGAGKSTSNKPAAAPPAATTTTHRSTTTKAATTTAPSTTASKPTTTMARPTTTKPPATQPATTHPAPTQPPITQPATTQPAAPADPGDSKNCSDFATYADAKSWFDMYFPYYGDVAGLDADGDGIPCESLPGAP